MLAVMLTIKLVSMTAFLVPAVCGCCVVISPATARHHYCCLPPCFILPSLIPKGPATFHSFYKQLVAYRILHPPHRRAFLLGRPFQYPLSFAVCRLYAMQVAITVHFQHPGYNSFHSSFSGELISFIPLMEEKSPKLFLTWQANDAWPIQFIPFAKRREGAFVSGHLTCLSYCSSTTINKFPSHWMFQPWGLQL